MWCCCLTRNLRCTIPTRPQITSHPAGSHRWEEDRRPDEGGRGGGDRVVQAVMPAGSVALWLGGTFHGLGASTTPAPRTGFIYSFVVDRFTQEENQLLAIPPDVARTLPERAQQLLGYRSSPNINWVIGLDQKNMLREGETSLFGDHRAREDDAALDRSAATATASKL